MALNVFGSLNVWGNNSSGQLGLSEVMYTKPEQHIPGPLKAIFGGSSHSALLSNTRVFTVGSNAFGQLGIGSTTDSKAWVFQGEPYHLIAGGADHTFEATSWGLLFGFGKNDHGQIGDGTTVNRTRAVQVSGISYVTGIASGHGDHSAALTTPPLLLSSIKVSPTSVTGGTSAVGTATITFPAGPGGQRVSLTSASASAGVPASVFIPAGAKSANFTITTKPVSSQVKAKITGSLVVIKTATLTINP
jgi:hypothetical protein